jgi:hypothetical protein
MRNLIVLAVVFIIAAAANSSPVSAHHLKSPEEMCSYTTRGDCLLAKRFLYEYCHQPERVNEEECVKWPTLDSATEVTPIASSTPTPTPTATPSASPTSQSEPISAGTESTKSNSGSSKTSLDPAVSPSVKPTKETSTQTVGTEAETPTPQPTSTIVANAPTTPDGTQEKKETSEKVTFFSARTRVGLVIGLIVLLIAALIAEAKQSKK